MVILFTVLKSALLVFGIIIAATFLHMGMVISCMSPNDYRDLQKASRTTAGWLNFWDNYRGRITPTVKTIIFVLYAGLVAFSIIQWSAK